MRPSYADMDQNESDLDAIKGILFRFMTRIECCPCNADVMRGRRDEFCEQCQLDIAEIDSLEKRLDYGPLVDRSGLDSAIHLGRSARQDAV